MASSESPVTSITSHSATISGQSSDVLASWKDFTHNGGVFIQIGGVFKQIWGVFIQIGELLLLDDSDFNFRHTKLSNSEKTMAKRKCKDVMLKIPHMNRWQLTNFLNRARLKLQFYIKMLVLCAHLSHK